MQRRATGITLTLTVALALGLSFAPLPEALRPFPALAGEAPLEVAAQMLMPQRKTGFGQKDAITGAPLMAEGLTDTPPEALPPEEDGLLLAAEVPSDEGDEGAKVEVGPLSTLPAIELREVRALERLAARVQATHVEVEFPEALEPFFTALEGMAQGDGPVRVVHLGDSQIASDHITDVVRRRLELRHGSAGPGFLFVDRPTKGAGRTVRTGLASDGWDVVKLTDRARPGLLGFSGVRFTGKAGQHARFDVRGADTVELAYVSADGELELSVDGRPLRSVPTLSEEDGGLAFAEALLPKGARTLTVTSRRGEVSLFGVTLERGGRGVVYDTVGLPGAQFEVYLRATEGVFTQQLQRRDPRLVVLMLGGNEAYEIGRGWITLDAARKSAEGLVDRVRDAAPDAACLLVAPMDAAVRTVGGDLEPRPNTPEVGAMIREVAQARGCAFWDLYAAMGGERSVARWLEAGLFNQDLVHPRARGADVLGHLFDFALERARLSRPAAQVALASAGIEAPGMIDVAGGKALSRVAKRLGDRPVMVQLGASHTASHHFTDVVREELQKVHGDGGRGFVAAGRPSDRLANGKVRRTLEGEWEIPDARERPPGEIWGLTGVRAMGAPGAKLGIAFGVGLSGKAAQPNEPAVLSLHYLQMGALRVRIDGQVVAELGPFEGMESPRAVVERFEVKGLSHELTVENVGDGPVTIFGASLERSGGGLVYDALGLPGSTVALADGYEKTALVEQLRARKPDLYVLFYGTNESALGDLSEEAHRRHYVSFLRTLREAAPTADCVLIGPTDRLASPKAGETNARAVVAIDRVLKVIREVAAAEGCAFWSARQAMGGPLSMARWQSWHPPLGHEDGVHLTPEGYAALARAFADDLQLALQKAQRAADLAEGSGR